MWRLSGEREWAPDPAAFGVRINAGRRRLRRARRAGRDVEGADHAGVKVDPERSEGCGAHAAKREWAPDPAAFGVRINAGRRRLRRARRAGRDVERADHAGVKVHPEQSGRAAGREREYEWALDPAAFDVRINAGRRGLRRARRARREVRDVERADHAGIAGEARDLAPMWRSASGHQILPPSASG